MSRGSQCPDCGRLVGGGAHSCPTDYSFLQIPSPRYGEQHPNWRGDEAATGTKRDRARRRFPLGPCEICGDPNTERHHRDGDTGNNDPVRVSRDTAWFHYTHRLNQGFSFHMHCHTHIDWEHTR